MLMLAATSVLDMACGMSAPLPALGAAHVLLELGWSTQQPLHVVAASPDCDKQHHTNHAMALLEVDQETRIRVCPADDAASVAAFLLLPLAIITALHQVALRHHRRLRVRRLASLIRSFDSAAERLPPGGVIVLKLTLHGY